MRTAIIKSIYIPSPSQLNNEVSQNSPSLSRGYILPSDIMFNDIDRSLLQLVSIFNTYYLFV